MVLCVYCLAVTLYVHCCVLCSVLAQLMSRVLSPSDICRVTYCCFVHCCTCGIASLRAHNVIVALLCTHPLGNWGLSASGGSNEDVSTGLGLRCEQVGGEGTATQQEKQGTRGLRKEGTITQHADRKRHGWRRQRNDNHRRSNNRAWG